MGEGSHRVIEGSIYDIGHSVTWVQIRYASTTSVFSTSHQRNAVWLYCCAMSPFPALTTVFVSPRRVTRATETCSALHAGLQGGGKSSGLVGMCWARIQTDGPVPGSAGSHGGLQQPDRAWALTSWMAGGWITQVHRLPQAPDFLSSPHHWLWGGNDWHLACNDEDPPDLILTWEDITKLQSDKFARISSFFFASLHVTDTCTTEIPSHSVAMISAGTFWNRRGLAI